MVTVRSISYGGGIQSTAMLILAANRTIDAPLAVFANVGEHAENPATLAYVRDVAAPYCESHGIELVERGRGGKWPDLFDRLTHPESRFIGIPIRMNGNGAPGNRACTYDYKMVVIGRELKARGASKDNPAVVNIGISTDEWKRANNRRSQPFEDVHYPLLELGMSREDCRTLIQETGLPVPVKSSCWFCPFHSKHAWRLMRAEQPGMFNRACDLEDEVNRKRAAAGRDPVWLSDALIPLRQAVPAMQTLPLFEDHPEDGECDSGWCMT